MITFPYVTFDPGRPFSTLTFGALTDANVNAAVAAGVKVRWMIPQITPHDWTDQAAARALDAPDLRYSTGFQDNLLTPQMFIAVINGSSPAAKSQIPDACVSGVLAVSLCGGGMPLKDAIGEASRLVQCQLNREMDFLAAAIVQSAQPGF